MTRCATCLMPFLEQSWQAIGRSHCGQFASVALDDSEPEASESGPTEESDQKEMDPPPADSKPESTRLELAPIPEPLREVPINLK